MEDLVQPRGCPYTAYLAKKWRARAFNARQAYLRWLEKFTLHDFKAGGGSNGWIKAVLEVQRPYPGTSGWLLSCSAPRSEGGHGRWIPNSQGSGAGGWLQFMEGTWRGFFWRAHTDVTGRGFIVPHSAESWYSPLGQALAGAWGITHGMRSHWSGSGC